MLTSGWNEVLTPAGCGTGNKLMASGLKLNPLRTQRKVREECERCSLLQHRDDK